MTVSQRNDRRTAAGERVDDASAWSFAWSLQAAIAPKDAEPRASQTAARPAFTAPGLTDPEAAQQWHLAKLGGIADVWAEYTGKGVHVGIYDSGVEYTHYDLDDHYDASRHVTINGVTYDGDYRPTSGPHGTAVAGLIAAERNGVGTVGVAYGSSLTSVNIFDPVSGGNNQPGIFLNARDLVYEALQQGRNFDVVNHSWGLNNTTFGDAAWRLDPAGPAFDEAESLRIVAEQGRGGLGTVIVKSAGNYGVDGQGDPLSTIRHVISVAAYRELDNYAASYSSRGTQLLVSAPSSDFIQIGGTGIVTSDLMGRRGYNLRLDPGGNRDYTDTFGGTSASAPMVTGVVALMLDANEGLGWRDVKNILAASATAPRGVGADPGGYQGETFVRLNESRFKMAGQDAHWNGGAMHYSTDYGYGGVNALAAVRMAEVWSLFGGARTSANEQAISTPALTVNLSYLGQGEAFDPETRHVDFLGTPVRYTFEIGENIDLEHVDMTLGYSFSYEGRGGRAYGSLTETQLKLIAPDGTEAFVDTASALRSSSNTEQSFTFGFTNFRGVESAGTWAFEFLQPNGTPLVEMKTLQLNGWGSAVSADDVHTYTNEFFDMVALSGESGRQLLLDADNGMDWINAAAVTSAVELSLAEGSTTRFGGRDAFTTAAGSRIEGAVTGDGNDRLLGNALNNRLYGMRGDDWLNGGDGNDALFGGTGSDVFAFDTAGVSGKDRVLDWSAGDRIATSKVLRGADQNGLLTLDSTGLVLLDGNVRGDTVELVGRGGAVLQALGREGGYWWYGFVSGENAGNEDGRVVELALGQTGRPPVDALVHATDLGTTASVSSIHASAFYLYETMGDAMSSGVQTFA